jgi:predicted phage terminase large subunit-like protein
VEFAPICPPELREFLTPDEVALIDLAERRFPLIRSPASMAAALDPNFKVAAHIDLLDRHLVALQRGDIDRLLVIEPPRHGKTELASKWFPAWCLYLQPDDPIVLASYGDDYSRGISRQTRAIIDSTPDLELKLAADSRSSARWNLAGFRGGLRAVGVGGQLTGAGAARLLLDDVVKDWQEAQSPTIRDSTWDWYASTARTRLQGEHPTVSMVCTLWHENDLGSRLRASGAFHVLHLRALAVEDETLESVSTVPADKLVRYDGDSPASWSRAKGEALWPERYDREWLERTRSEVGPQIFECLYQGDPTPAGGNLFPALPRWSVANWGDGQRWMLGAKAVNPKSCWLFAICDLAVTVKTQADYTVFGVFAVTPDNELVLVDGVRDRIAAEDHYGRLHPMLERWNCRFEGIENSLHTTRLVTDLARQGIPTRELRPDRDKITRALPATVRAHNSTLWLPAEQRFDAWAQEALAFPNGQHDDVVDVLAYAAMVVPNTPRQRRTTEFDGSPLSIISRHRDQSRRRRGVHPDLGRL